MATKFVVLSLLLWVASANFLEELRDPALLCYKYQCAPQTFDMPKGTCIYPFNNSTKYLSICDPESTTYCNTDIGFCRPRTTPPVEPSWPGEPCSSVVPCKYGTCTKGRCKGQDLGGSCTCHDMCNPGLRCDSTNKCSLQIGTNDEGCRTYEDCNNDATCNYTEPATTGKCVGFFTQQNGALVTDCIAGISYMCNTMTCKSLNLASHLGICVDGIQTVGEPPVTCYRDTDCLGTDGEYFYYGSCSCGYNIQGLAYCNPFPGDVVAQNLGREWNKALNDANECNTVRRFSDKCLLMTGYLKDVTEAVWGYMNYSQVQNNDECVREIFTYDYHYG